jgi:hypothetical protein
MFSILRQSAAYWVAMASFRKQRERCKRYTYGDQWHDRICVDGQWMREEDYIRQQGNEPLKNNLIRRLVRNVIGLYRQQHTASLSPQAEPSSSPSLGGGQGEVSLSPSLGGGQGEVIGGQGEALEVSARTLEEFLISGLAVLRQSWGTRRGITGCWTDIVAPDSFFVDTFARDPSGWDISCIGELHDMPFSVLCRHFASSPDDVQHLQRVYNVADYDDRLADVCELFGQQSPAIDFFHARGNLCRVVEVWRLEQQQRYRCHDTATGELYQVSADDYPSMVVAENERRLNIGRRHGKRREEVALIHAQWFIAEQWHYYFLTPFGDVLSQGVSPYTDGGHPYVFKAYPFIDGEIHSFVADLIDQQRYTNRLITLYDWIMRSSAKGVLLVPEESIPDGYSLADIADEWARFNGVIAIRTKNGAQMPQQVAMNATNVGIKDLLQTQLDFFEDISGVAGVLQGKRDGNSNNASLFAYQTNNATLSLLDIIETFQSFIDEVALNKQRLQQQFGGKG